MKFGDASEAARVPWAHGPARLDGDQIVMQVVVGDAKDALHITQGIDVELSKIRTPTDALTFVRRFGLLERGAYFADSQYVSGPHTTPDDEIPVEVREPFALFLETAEDLRTIVETMKLV